MEDILRFYQEHKVKIEEVYELKEETRNYFYSAVADLANKLKKPLKFTRNKDYRSILLFENPDLHLVCYFGLDEDHSEFSYSITLEVFNPSIEMVNKIKKEKMLYTKLNNHTISKPEEPDQGDWCMIAIKYYRFDNLAEGLFNVLDKTFESEWKPYIEEVRTLVKQYE